MKKLILGIIIGILISSGIVYGVNLYSASNIEYTTSDGRKTNVNDAINDIYNNLNSSSQIIDLGTGTSFDVSNYEGYQNFTEANFLIEPVISTSSTMTNQVKPQYSNVSGMTVQVSASMQKAYDKNTGIFTCQLVVAGSTGYATTAGTVAPSTSSVGGVHAYLILD